MTFQAERDDGVDAGFSFYYLFKEIDLCNLGGGICCLQFYKCFLAGVDRLKHICGTE